MNIEELNERVNNLKEEVKSVKNINVEIRNLCVQMKELTVEMKYMRETQESHEARIKTLEEKPIKKLDTISTTILAGIVGTILGVVLSMIGLK